MHSLPKVGNAISCEHVGIYFASGVLLLEFGMLYNAYFRPWRQVNLVFDSLCDAAADLEVARRCRKSGRFSRGPLHGAGTPQVAHRCRSVSFRQTGAGLPTPPSPPMSNDLRLEHHDGGAPGAR